MKTATPETPSPPASARSASTNPEAPRRRDLALLATGLVLGVLLGPLGLGRLAPEIHDRLFIGSTVRLQHRPSAALERELDRARRHDREAMEVLQNTGVSAVAVHEERARRERARRPLRRRVLAARRAACDQWFASLRTALILVIVLGMVLEAAPARRPSRPGGLNPPAWRDRLRTLRYALMALWLGIVLARTPAVGLSGVSAGPGLGQWPVSFNPVRQAHFQSPVTAGPGLDRRHAK